MPIVAVPVSEYEGDKEMREKWHNILSSPELLKRLPSDIWHGHKLQELLWSGKIDITKSDWEERLVELWKKSR